MAALAWAESGLFNFVLELGRIGLEFLFAVVAAEGHFFTLVRDGDVSAGGPGADRASFVHRGGMGKAGEGKDKAEENGFHGSE